MPHRLHMPDPTETTAPLDLVAVDRAVSDLRRGGIVVVRGDQKMTLLALAAEGATPAAMDRLRDLSGSEPTLVITHQRARQLGIGQARDDADTTPLVLRPEDGLNAWLTTGVIDPLSNPEAVANAEWETEPAAAEGCESAAIGLVKVARMLPAVVVARLTNPKAVSYPVPWAENIGLLVVEAGQIFDYEMNAARSLQQVSDARVPLDNAEDSRIVAFRPADGGIEHLAIIIGAPKPGAPVLTRLHSECFTGDLLGSLRCDCGEQLRGAITEIARTGGGVLLYLAQEGRGIGLVNKLRAYELQDQGLDTIDANVVLGFDADERVFLPAVEMLRQLGFDRVRLLTNNPDKVDALSRFGIEVVERVTHRFPSNQHNELYLRTKAERSGHLF